jgi:hypothetical protein
MTITVVRVALRAFATAASSAATSGASNASAPSARACATKSTGESAGNDSFHKLLCVSPAVARCSRWMQPKPRLSQSTTSRGCPLATEVAISEFIMR